jgi:hypothetical protein
MLSFFAVSVSTAAATSTSSTTAAATTAAAATCAAIAHHVGVGDDKPAALEAINVIDVSSLNQRSAVGVNQNLYAASVNNDIFGLSFGLKAKDVLCSAVTARGKGYSEICVRRSLLVKDLFQLDRRGFRDGKEGRTFSRHL